MKNQKESYLEKVKQTRKKGENINMKRNNELGIPAK